MKKRPDRRKIPKQPHIGIVTEFEYEEMESLLTPEEVLNFILDRLTTTTMLVISHMKLVRWVSEQEVDQMIQFIKEREQKPRM